MPKGRKRLSAEERGALDALGAVAKKFPAKVFRWAMRKHLAIEAARASAAKEIQELKNRLASLENSTR